MIGHYLATAFRNFRRRPLSTGIKFLALALGFACFLAANLVAEYVASVDRQWANDGRIYSISQAVTAPGSENESRATIGAIARPAIEYLKTDFPDIVIAATEWYGVPLRAEGKQIDGNTLAVDPEFIQIFDLDMAAGSADALSAPRSVLLEVTAARELFGSADAVGRSVRLSDADMTVAGVFRWPAPSHLGPGSVGRDIRVLITRTAYRDVGLTPSFRPTWASACCTTYALFPESGPSLEALQQRLEHFSATRVPPEFGTVRFAFMPLAEMGEAYLDRGLFGGSLDFSIMTILSVFAALVLAVACLDFVNLATAEAVARSREIGVRKTLGASRRHVIAQTVVETAVLAISALVAVVPLAVLAVPVLGRALRLQIAAMDVLARADYWFAVTAAAVAVCAAASAYPALVSARVRPISSLGARDGRGSAGTIRGALIVAQFAAASFLLAGVAVMLLQEAALRDRLTDPSQDPRLIVNVVGRTSGPVPGALRPELLSHSAVTGVTTSAWQPFGAAGSASGQIARSEDPNASRIPIQMRYVSHDYFGVTGIRLLTGRDFDETLDEPGTAQLTAAAGSGRNLATPPRHVIIDERTAARLGFTPEQAIGQLLYESTEVQSSSGASGGAARAATVSLPVEVVGVAAATPLEYLGAGPDNYLYAVEPRAVSTIIVRIARDDVAAGLAHVDATWRKFFPDHQIQRTFLDEAFDTSFAMFDMLGSTFAGLSVMAMVIAAAGLFGIASFVVQRRTREIGVRKTLGATSFSVLGLVVWDFTKLVILANVIAWPLAVIAARRYLDLFVQRIDLSPGPFVLALAVSLLIAWLAVVLHALRAAQVQPALVLRTE